MEIGDHGQHLQLVMQHVKDINSNIEIAQIHSHAILVTHATEKG